MQLPESLRTGIQDAVLAAAIPRSSLVAAARTLSTSYRETERPQTARMPAGQALAYAATRMPATYAALSMALAELPSDHGVQTARDVGAGTGAGAWAIRELLGERVRVVCEEKDPAMSALGRRLTPFGEWREANQPSVKADLVLLSYVLGEVRNPLEFAAEAWRSTGRYLVIVEPGTTRGFERIAALRTLGSIVAPCPHSQACPMAAAKDWCHFAARVERTALHRQLKGGELSHEDEKFSYLILERREADAPPATPADWSRVVRHPFTEPGQILLQLCAPSGSLEKRAVRKRSHPDEFRKARKASWGDRL